MKYMTFNSSCAFAGVANMLSILGVEVEDRDIALGMKLPFLFEKEEGAYLAGPMLQSAKWFNLYMNPIGFEMKERFDAKEEVPAVLMAEKTAMLGIRVSPRDKHAVVYTGTEGECFCFLNNKWAHTEDPEVLTLSQEDLLSRLDDTVVIATLHPCGKKNADFAPLYRRSCEILVELKEELTEFCAIEKTREEILTAMNPLFRPMLLDGITMLDLIGQTELASKLRTVQIEFMSAIREGVPVVLADVMQMDVLMDSIDEYITLIASKSGV